MICYTRRNDDDSDCSHDDEDCRMPCLIWLIFLPCRIYTNHVHTNGGCSCGGGQHGGSPHEYDVLVLLPDSGDSLHLLPPLSPPPSPLHGCNDFDCHVSVPLHHDGHEPLDNGHCNRPSAPHNVPVDVPGHDVPPPLDNDHGRPDSTLLLLYHGGHGYCRGHAQHGNSPRLPLLPLNTNHAAARHEQHDYNTYNTFFARTEKYHQYQFKK